MKPIGDTEIRLMLLCPVNRKRISELMISQGDEDIRSYIRSGYDTSAKLAAVMGIRLQSASTRLDKLYRKGYLVRDKEQQPSGGYEWRYRNIYQTKVSRGEP